MKKKTLMTAVALTGAAVITASFGFAGCAPSDKDEKNSVVALDINPSIELVVDNDNKVVSVYGTNEDGQVLLYGEADEMKGKPLSDAIDAITRSAIELGYLTEDNKVVQYVVNSGAGQKTIDKINELIDTRVAASASAMGVGFTVETDASGAYSLMRKYQAFIAEHPDMEGKISVNKFSLALSASDTGISLEAAVELSDKELIKTVTKARSDVAEFATSAYNAAKAEAERVYDSVALAAIDNVYAEYYLTHFTSHITTAYLGGQYSVYSSAARSLDAIADVIVYSGKLINTALDSNQTKAVLSALGMTDEEVDKLKDADGHITIESVEAYADIKFKNSEASAQLENMKNELSRALNTAESAIKAAADKINEEYGDELAELAENAKSVITAITNAAGAVSALLPESFKNAVNELKDVAAELGDLVKDGVSVSDIRTLAASLRTKADNTLKKIEKDLSADELKEVAALKDKKEKSFADAKAAMQKALDNAEQTARERLEALRQKRENQSV